MKFFIQPKVFFIFLTGILFIVIFAGCNRGSMIKIFTSPEDEAVATNYISLLREKKFDQIEKDLDPSLKGTADSLIFEKMADDIPAQDPISIKVVGANQIHDSGSYKINLTFEYQFPSKWLLINVVTQRKDGNHTIIGFTVHPLKDSLENINKFTLAGKNLLQYTTLASAVLIPLFTLYALVLCIKTKMQKRKWLWIIFIVLGIGKFTVNWTTGQWSFMPLSFQLFGASSFAPFYGAWLISVSLPLGAILFLIRRKKYISIETIGSP